MNKVTVKTGNIQGLVQETTMCNAGKVANTGFIHALLQENQGDSYHRMELNTEYSMDRW